MFDKDLIQKINSGRCFVLVGSGPSCEVGYPSWKKLAELTYKELTDKGRVTDHDSYKKYLKAEKYPEFFRQAERDLNDRASLINMIKPLLDPPSKKSSTLYELLSKWPFACYLTTNYDDEIENYLSKFCKQHFSLIRNRKKDFFNIRDSVSHIIQKLHSDLNFSEEVVLTSTDYNRFYVDDSGQYFRDKLRQIFEMFDVFIIGHSLSDPDIKYILQLAKKTAGPEHPIYMVAADFTKADEKEYLEKFNIVLVRYSNKDGSHSQLRRMLKTVDPYIVSRDRLSMGTEIPKTSKEETDTAVALFLYQRLQGAEKKAYLSPIVLRGLFMATDEMSSEDIMSSPALTEFTKGTNYHNDSINEAIESLIQQDLVVEASEKFAITSSGHDKMQEYRAVRETEKDQAYGQFNISLKNCESAITDSQMQECANLAEEVIVASFKNRAITIANQVFSGQSARPEELSDVFGLVSDKAINITDITTRTAFIEAMHQFIITPNHPQKKYLTSISQGFFLYHLLGQDPNCLKARQDIFQKTVWLCDASVLLPLAAIGCHNHKYASELFQMLNDANAVLYTTPSLLEEAWKHFEWALNFIKANGAESSEFLRATLVKGSYKQNLFLDGYIRLCAGGEVGSFKDYLKLFLPNEIDKASFETHITRSGLTVKKISEIDGFVQEDWGDYEEAKASIQAERINRGSYSSELQVASEAEVWVFIKNLWTGKYSLPNIEGTVEKVYFASQGRILDHVFQQGNALTWTPETIYRYVTAVLPGRETSPDLLQQCMLHDYYYAGVSFIDRDLYTRFFGPTIDAAKISYKNEKANYIASVEGTHTGQLDSAFEKTPDLEKPFFITQMAWKAADASKRREEIAIQRAKEAETKVKLLEAEKGKAWKNREKNKQEQEVARQRNLKDPKHVRKLQKQAKKRKKERGN